MAFASQAVAGATVRGDSTKRITVPMPHSLNQLRGHAGKIAAASSPIQMRLWGDTEIKGQGDVSMLQNDDVIVVSQEQFRQLASEIHKSTQNLDYVSHNVKAPLRAKAPTDAKAPPTRFDGNTIYNTDYPAHHNVKMRDSCKPKQEPPYDRGKAKGAPNISQYRQEFPWHEPQPRRTPFSQARKLEPSTPFNGTTSYNADYVKHQVRPRSATPKPTANKNAVTPGGTFNGNTTYVNDYTSHKGHSPARIIKGRSETNLGHGIGPFMGDSEYRNEYLHKARRMDVIHLEPELPQGTGAARSPTRSQGFAKGTRDSAVRAQESRHSPRRPRSAMNSRRSSGRLS